MEFTIDIIIDGTIKKYDSSFLMPVISNDPLNFGQGVLIQVFEGERAIVNCRVSHSNFSISLIIPLQLQLSIVYYYQSIAIQSITLSFPLYTNDSS